ncbi:3602_t:CDS:2 [Scutellospora calospora]|uniref:3602_t:CDS:1 n=1 Tax=Scutellospora calospora TaxID=85575 RepID=A0ACA9L1P7_9GLOM|nr:3602_t:CDS:2 [Scutellospora calospora]
MTDFESTYMEEFDSSEEEYEDAFIIDPMFLESTQALLHDDKSEDIDLDEIEPENSDPYNENFSRIDDEIDVEIEENSMRILNLASCVIIDNIQGEINNGCTKHSWNVNGRNIQAPCIGVFDCPAFSEGYIAKKSSSSYHAHYICSEYFQQNSGHLYERPGKGKDAISCIKHEKYRNDISDALRLIGKWIISVAESDDHKLQERLLSQIFLVLNIINDETINKNSRSDASKSNTSKLDALTSDASLLTIEKPYLTLKKASVMGEKVGKEILYSRPEIKNNLNQLENPSSYNNYFEALPIIIRSFFQALLIQTMMLKIKAAQSEKNRLSILLAEYVDNVVMSQNFHVIKSRKDSLWSLVAKLSSAFNHLNPTAHYLFEDASKISEEGIKNILSFYETGKSRFEEILAQDVYKTVL